MGDPDSEHGHSGQAAVVLSRRALRDAAGDPDQLAALLDEVAASAAAGSETSLDTLLWAVDALGLGRGVVQRIVVDRDDVDDVTQNVLVAVAETIGTFRGEARFTTWLHQVARFKAIAHLRRKRNESRLDDDRVAVPDTTRISSLLAGQDRLDALLAALPDHYRDAVVLRDVNQLPYDDVARRLGVSPGTVKSRVARGRALVAARLARG